MTLENRVAYWINAGTTNYLQVYELQANLAQLRKAK